MLLFYNSKGLTNMKSLFSNKSSMEKVTDYFLAMENSGKYRLGKTAKLFVLLLLIRDTAFRQGVKKTQADINTEFHSIVCLLGSSLNSLTDRYEDMHYIESFSDKESDFVIRTTNLPNSDYEYHLYIK